VATSPREYLVYADGSCIGNPGRGGWGVVVRDPDGVVTELNGHDDTTTNNRMELMGAIEGLRATAPGASVILRSDSQYVVKTMMEGWKRKANLDLWELLDAERAERSVRFEWVRGHDTDATNNRADELALSGANGKLVANGTLPGKKPKLKGDESATEAELAALLRPGEEIRKCEQCGAKFVSRADELSCSHARCQLEARRRPTK
jgi:ribonuclease HI